MVSNTPQTQSGTNMETANSRSRDSKAVRESILNTALELGVGRNRTVTNWMFNGIDEDEEEEESTMSPALTTTSTATSDDSVLSTPQTGSLTTSMYPGPVGRVTPLPTRIEFDLSRPAPTPDIPVNVPSPIPTSTSGFLKYRLGKSKSKRDDGYETDGANSAGSKLVKKKKKDKTAEEGYETDGATTNGGSKKKKSKKDDGEESDGGYLSDFARIRRKKGKGKKSSEGGYETEGDGNGTPKKHTDKKAKSGSPPGDETDGYLSEASSKRKKSFFSRSGKSGSNSRNSPSSATPPPVPALPSLPVTLPIADRFVISRSDTSLSQETVDTSNLQSLQRMMSHDSSSSPRGSESTTREDVSIGHSISSSIDRSGERNNRSLDSPQASNSWLRGDNRKIRFKFSANPSKNGDAAAANIVPIISLPNSRSISPMPSPGGISPRPVTDDQSSALKRPVPPNLTIPSPLNPKQGSRNLSPPRSLNSDYIFITPNGTPNKSSNSPFPVSPSPSDYSMVPSIPGAEYTNPSPQPSPRPGISAHHDLPPPTPPPTQPLPDIPGPQIRASRAVPSSSFLDFEAQSPPISRSTSPLYSPNIQRGREAPFPAKPLLSPGESADLVQRTAPRSTSALGYNQRPSERLRRGGNEDGIAYLDPRLPPSAYIPSSSSGGALLVRPPSAMARIRPEVSVVSDVMSGININVEQASEAGDLDDRAELDEVLSRFQEENVQEIEPSIPPGSLGAVLSPGLRSPNSYRNSRPQAPPLPGIFKGRNTRYEIEEEGEEEGEEEYGEIEDEVDDDDRSFYPEDDKTAGRATMYMLENGEEDVRYSMYTDGDRTSRGSFLNEDRSWDARERFLRRVAAMYEESGREKPPPVPKLDPRLRTAFTSP